jgi:hypothetical protein
MHVGVLSPETAIKGPHSTTKRWTPSGEADSRCFLLLHRNRNVRLPVKAAPYFAALRAAAVPTLGPLPRSEGRE